MLRVVFIASVIFSSPIVGSANDRLHHSPWTRRVRIALGRSALDYRPAYESTVRFTPENTIRRPFYRAHNDLPSDTTDSRDEYYERMDSSENEAVDSNEIPDFESNLKIGLEKMDDDSLLFVSAMQKLAGLLHQLEIFEDFSEDKDSSVLWSRLIEIAKKKLENVSSKKSGSGVVCVSYGNEGDSKTDDEQIRGGQKNEDESWSRSWEVDSDEGEEPSHRMSFDDLSQRRSPDNDNAKPPETSLVPAAASPESRRVSRFEIRDRFLREKPNYVGEYRKPVENTKSAAVA